jgi:hypothetical protein
MDRAPFIQRTAAQAATGEESLAGRDALVALARLLARQAARDTLSAFHQDQENNGNDEEA